MLYNKILQIVANAVLCFLYFTISMDNLVKAAQNEECLTFAKQDEFIRGMP